MLDFSENFTLSAAVAYNDGNTTDDFVYCPMACLSVPDGTELPNVPEWKGNILGRYTLSSLGEMPAYAQLLVELQREFVERDCS